MVTWGAARIKKKCLCRSGLGCMWMWCVHAAAGYDTYNEDRQPVCVVRGVEVWQDPGDNQEMPDAPMLSTHPYPFTHPC